MATTGLFGDLEDPRAIEAAVRAQLADSLAYIASQAGSNLTVDKTTFDAAIEGIRRSKQDPGVFARYFDLVFAVNENRLADANALLAEIVARTAEPVAFEIVPYSREVLGSDYDRFPALLFAEYSSANPMATPTRSRSEESAAFLREAIAIVSRIDRSLYDEIDAFLSRVYLAVGSTDPLARRFGGVTSLLVWGASFANIEFLKSPWDAAQFLVHEITHALLFGIAIDRPLVENSPDESYKSPLRPDPRPMDGIFHATLVCARLTAFNRAWLDSGSIDEADRVRSEAAVAKDARAFSDGLEVVNRHGKLSAEARDLIDRSALGLLEFA